MQCDQKPDLKSKSTCADPWVFTKTVVKPPAQTAPNPGNQTSGQKLTLNNRERSIKFVFAAGTSLHRNSRLRKCLTGGSSSSHLDSSILLLLRTARPWLPTGRTTLTYPTVSISSSADEVVRVWRFRRPVGSAAGMAAPTASSRGVQLLHSKSPTVSATRKEVSTRIIFT